MAGPGETACPTIDSKQLALVAQALSPADFDFSRLLSSDSILETTMVYPLGGDDSDRTRLRGSLCFDAAVALGPFSEFVQGDRFFFEAKNLFYGVITQAAVGFEL
jgi:hypothetical protein